MIPEADDLTHTHFYRWHIDSAMYDLDPPLMTSLLAVKVPKTRTQILCYDDGSGHEITVPLGTTAFFSGFTLFNSLSPEDKKFVKTTKVEYAAHPYIWMSKAKSRPNGLGLVSQNLELDTSQLPPIDLEKIKTYPMTWRNHITNKLALMVYPTAARRLHLKDRTVIDDLKEVREILYKLQRPGIEPQFVYTHDWVEGDLVLFNNHGVMHSVVGAFGREEVRIFRQCNMAGSRAPVGSEGDLVL
jgi:alpha-ketoglutarate-dependent taurine dioxygenase